MAKSSRVSVSPPTGASSDQLRNLCTAAERALLAMSDDPGLSKAVHADVQALLVRTRTFRDKWRALTGEQTRVVKRAPRAVAEANARTRAKADLFDAAVKRVEARLKALVPAAGEEKRNASKPVITRKTTPKRARVAGNRAARAGLRSEFTRQVATLNKASAKRGVSKPVAAKPAASRVAAAAAAATKKVVPVTRIAEAKTTMKTASKPVSKKVVASAAGKSAARSKKRKLPPAAAAAQAIRYDGVKQRSARTAAKNARLKVEGQVTRKGSHVIAAGKRSQARRDKRR
jgi:hypothetical protein